MSQLYPFEFFEVSAELRWQRHGVEFCLAQKIKVFRVESNETGGGGPPSFVREEWRPIPVALPPGEVLDFVKKYSCRPRTIVFAARPEAVHEKGEELWPST